ncbi:hypothetical protein HN51_035612 [Arachis hypogaea]|uniref:glycerophosphodiester phosphodiesterase n=2 Tax=Arachis hypogaea TaxID=3818 RepID=A0A445A3K8_ARAHY|nr:glycerophosphodiester phosphodiesterase GDPDL3 [Arachis ipaensis]XP_025643887.1 glycerophosphodiester phosphodiesterase GDPDL3 isoform X1 [Arachis hypogaea]XP_029147362.1 glycerophosphodiester phosphodiesterase GDPDL3 isoform X1 [Arachis hypogaea]QHO00761.1 Glycerophosphodiester phosphodiesterase [Arachis hypogaea]QHO00762.1 Glycerophosphodiester phosphodiesterase [Arachis hypogaea]RYR21031.1 hypothetical protein Ahy_B03g066269 [Arachis hypogaea]
MWSSSSMQQPLLLQLLVVQSLLVAVVLAQRSTTPAWNTLTGNRPLVVARGGFSGLFPDSTSPAYQVALSTSVSDVLLWCDVQLTKDGFGLCLADVKIDNDTDIANFYPNKSTTYSVNGVRSTGYFSVDYTSDQLANVSVVQAIYSRTNLYYGLPILTVDDIAALSKPQPSIWMNIQHDAFFSQHKLSMRSFVLAASKRVVISYISSPEVGFLRSITSRLPKVTKLVFRFMGQDVVEPSTNQTYGSLLKNLTFIKTFASGILVPKGYIWPVDSGLYLQPHTSLVSDAHKAGLEVFASDFANDNLISYNYSYDPLAEYLQFIDNGDFSVDGVLSDFPITPSEAVDCFAHLGTNATKKVNTLVISKYGASGDYPACTDLAYTKAISDGVDILDCPVQLSKDGVPFCLSSIDLIETTNAAQSTFSTLATTIPEIKSGNGIFTFSLTWDNIKSLTPSILNPYTNYSLKRNPKNRNAGEFVTLSDFLSLAKNRTSLSGVMIIVENAAYLAKKQGLGVIDSVMNALSKAGYDKPGPQKVMIRSTSSSVLLKFKEKTNYELVYEVDETISNADNAAIADIKRFASSVVINKDSVFSQDVLFLTGTTKTVSKLKSSNLSVFVETFSNEFPSQAWDFFSDATEEINSYVTGAEIDGVITDFPKTANRYRRNKCLNLGNKTPPYMAPAQPGALFQAIPPGAAPPAPAPLPPLTVSEVIEPPLPAVSKISPSPAPAGTKTGGQGNAQSRVTICAALFSFPVLLASLLLI